MENLSNEQMIAMSTTYGLSVISYSLKFRYLDVFILLCSFLTRLCVYVSVYTFISIIYQELGRELKNLNLKFGTVI